MLILALDASTPQVTVALGCAEGNKRKVLAEVSTAERGASETLLVAVKHVLELGGEDLEAVERLLVGVGPGTFTGIRVAVSTARALSLGTGVPLSQNSTLAALAAPAISSCGNEVLAVLDAKRGQVFAQEFSRYGPAGGITCARPEELSGQGSSGSAPLLVGDGAVRYRDVLSNLGRIPPDDSPFHRVSAAGHILSAELEAVNPEEVVPLYVREPDAEVRRELNPWSRR